MADPKEAVHARLPSGGKTAFALSAMIAAGAEAGAGAEGGMSAAAMSGMSALSDKWAGSGPAMTEAVKEPETAGRGAAGRTPAAARPPQGTSLALSG